MRHRQRALDCMDALIRAIFFAPSKRKVSAVYASRLTAPITFVTTAGIHLPLDRNQGAAGVMSFPPFPLLANPAKTDFRPVSSSARRLPPRREFFGDRPRQASARTA